MEESPRRLAIGVVAGSNISSCYFETQIGDPEQDWSVGTKSNAAVLNGGKPQAPSGELLKPRIVSSGGFPNGPASSTKYCPGDPAGGSIISLGSGMTLGNTSRKLSRVPVLLAECSDIATTIRTLSSGDSCRLPFSVPRMEWRLTAAFAANSFCVSPSCLRSWRTFV